MIRKKELFIHPDFTNTMLISQNCLYFVLIAMVIGKLFKWTTYFILSQGIDK